MKFFFDLIAIAKSLFWLIIRKKKREDNPAIQYEQAKEQNAQAVANGDADYINRKLGRGLPLGPKAGGDSGG